MNEGMLASIDPFVQINSKPLVSVISGSREVWLGGHRERHRFRDSESVAS